MKIKHINGLDNFVIPKGSTGSAPSGNFGGNDFRAAYANSVPQTGRGQSIGLFELNQQYLASDIIAYEKKFNLPNVGLQTVLVDGLSGPFDQGPANLEPTLDIDMAIAMAPGLSSVIIYEGNYANSVIDAMADPPPGVPLSLQLSASWTYATDDMTFSLLKRIAAQGQSYFNNTGDNGAYPGAPGGGPQLSLMTFVGGTVLSMNGQGASWGSETSWSGSTGTVYTDVLIPNFQASAGINWSKNGGSTQHRNIPDVAMVATNVYVVLNGSDKTGVLGTSVSTPLWAAFTALVNELRGMFNLRSLGLANQLIYDIASGSRYAQAFNDITTGNNFSVASPSQFSAVPGFDLVTGWGTPKGSLVSMLAEVPVVPPPPPPPHTFPAWCAPLAAEIAQLQRSIQNAIRVGVGSQNPDAGEQIVRMERILSNATDQYIHCTAAPAVRTR